MHAHDFGRALCFGTETRNGNGRSVARNDRIGAEIAFDGRQSFIFDLFIFFFQLNISLC